MRFSGKAALGLGLASTLLVAVTHISAMSGAVAGVGTERPDAQLSPEKDSTKRRAEWNKWWFGEITNEYLDFKAELGQRELEKWGHMIPGNPRYIRPLDSVNANMPDNVWRNIGPWDGNSVQASTRDRNIVDNGRPTAILVHPTDPHTLYLGMAGGGLWRSTNANLASDSQWNWEPVTDSLPSGGNNSIGAAAFKPGDPNTIYISLGDMMIASANQTADGRGFFISRDRGDTWEKGGSLGKTNRTKTVLALENNIILVAGNFGLFRSTDGGTGFVRVQSGPLADRSGVQLPVISSGGTNFPPNEYATAWDIVRINTGANAGRLVLSYQFCDGGASYDYNSSLPSAPGNMPFSGYGTYGGGGIAYSDDNGASWTKAMDSGTMDTNPNRHSSTRGFGRISIAGSGSTLYGLAQGGAAGAQCIRFNTTGTSYALLKSTNGGATWDYINAVGMFNGTGAYSGDGNQFGYNQMIAVDPDNPDQVFVGTNMSVWRSRDGGATFECVSNWLSSSGFQYIHADMHLAAWNEVGEKALYVSTDGGLSIIRAPYITGTTALRSGSGFRLSDPALIDNRRTKGIAAHLIYSFGNTNATTPTDSKKRVIIGTQDNGTMLRLGPNMTGSGYSGFQFEDNVYDYKIGGDGFGCQIHRSNGDRMLGSLYDTRIYRSTNGGNTFSEITPASSDVFFTRIFQGYGDDDFLTFTDNTPYRSNPANIWTGSGTSAWVALTTTTASGWPRPYNTNGTINTTGSLAIRSMGASWAQQGFIAATFDRNEYNTSSQLVSRGAVAFSEDNGLTWRVTQGIPGNPGNLGDVVFDPRNPDIVYLCGVRPAVWNTAGQVWGNEYSHLWKSTDKGMSFFAIDGSLDNSNGFPFGSMVHMVRVDPLDSNFVYAATDYGIYRTTNQGLTWARFGIGMPLASIRDIYIAPDGSFMRVATHGRGVWEMEGLAPEFSAPVITTNPQNATIDQGRSATFTVAAVAIPAPTFQWQVSTNGTAWTNIAGATGSTYTSTFGIADHGKLFRAMAINSEGSVPSSHATLTVRLNYDIDGVSGVDVYDVLKLMSLFGSTDQADINLGDFNGDSKVDSADLTLLLDQF